MSRLVADTLAKKAAHYGNCTGLDALVNVDLGDRYLWPLEGALKTKVAAQLNRHGWRSVSMLSVPYGLVLCAGAGAPHFLADKVGRPLHEWDKLDGWFKQ
jgi:hypothetical protein